MKKNVKMIDVTNKKIFFNFNDLNFELMNIEINYDELHLSENQHSIVTLIKYKNTKLLLTGVLISKYDKKLKNENWYSYSEKFIWIYFNNKTKLKIITNNKIPSYSNQIISFSKQFLNSKIYLTQNVKGKQYQFQILQLNYVINLFLLILKFLFYLFNFEK